jgi:hypothetical protein
VSIIYHRARRPRVRSKGTKYRETLGFDKSYHLGRGVWKISCSQCEALVINGTPTHETGCPNTPHRNKGEDES